MVTFSGKPSTKTPLNENNEMIHEMIDLQMCIKPHHRQPPFSPLTIQRKLQEDDIEIEPSQRRKEGSVEQKHKK